jgi:hypothetical protein
MLDTFPHTPNEPLVSLPLWVEPLLLPAPEEVLDTEPTHITPNKLASVFRTDKKKTRKKNKQARKNRRKNKK